MGKGNRAEKMLPVVALAVAALLGTPALAAGMALEASSEDGSATVASSPLDVAWAWLGELLDDLLQNDLLQVEADADEAPAGGETEDGTSVNGEDGGDGNDDHSPGMDPDGHRGA